MEDMFSFWPVSGAAFSGRPSLDRCLFGDPLSPTLSAIFSSFRAERGEWVSLELARKRDPGNKSSPGPLEL